MVYEDLTGTEHVKRESLRSTVVLYKMGHLFRSEPDRNTGSLIFPLRS